MQKGSLSNCSKHLISVNCEGVSCRGTVTTIQDFRIRTREGKHMTTPQKLKIQWAGHLAHDSRPHDSNIMREFNSFLWVGTLGGQRGFPITCFGVVLGPGLFLGENIGRSVSAGWGLVPYWPCLWMFVLLTKNTTLQQNAVIRWLPSHYRFP